MFHKLSTLFTRSENIKIAFMDFMLMQYHHIMTKIIEFCICGTILFDNGLYKKNIRMQVQTQDSFYH